MRNLVIAAIGFGSAACSGAAAKADTAGSGDSNVVAGPPATTTPPAPAESVTPPVKKPPAPSASRPDAGDSYATIEWRRECSCWFQVSPHQPARQ